LLNALTPVQQPVQWSKLDQVFDSVVMINKDNDNDESGRLQRYDMVAERQEEALKERFPNPKDVQSIANYFRLIRKAYRAVLRAFVFKVLPYRVSSFLLRTRLIHLVDKGYHKFARQTVEQVVHSVTQNEELRRVLLYAWCDYGTPPNEAPFAAHALLTMHYTDGAFYPVGGPSEIPRRIGAVVRERGGELRVNAAVEQIWVEHHRVAGVHLRDGTRIRAKNVISNAGVMNTYQKLVPHAKYQSPALHDLFKNDRLKSGMTGLFLFVGLEGSSDRDLNLPKHQIWAFMDETGVGQGSESKSDDNSLPKGLPIFIGSPSVKDESWSRTRPNSSSLEILTPAPWDWFAEKWANKDPSDADYEQMRQDLAQRVWERSRQVLVAAGASESLPHNILDADFHKLGTPLDFSRHLGSDRGACYGLDHTTDRFDPKTFYLQLRPETRSLPGFYLTGQDISMCGMAGAMIGGYLCASKVMGILDPSTLLKKLNQARVDRCASLD